MNKQCLHEYVRDEVGAELAAGSDCSHVVSERHERNMQRSVTRTDHTRRVGLSLKPPEIVRYFRHAHLHVGDRDVGVEQ